MPESYFELADTILSLVAPSFLFSKTNVKQLVPVVYKLQQNLIKSARLVTHLRNYCASLLSVFRQGGARLEPQ